jgi:hypothetical protein
MASNMAGAKKSTLDRKMTLSTLWIFALINYIYADIFTVFFDPAADSATAANGAGAVLVFAVLMEAGIVMVLLSRILSYRANRWANVAAGLIQAIFVSWSLFGEPPRPFYVFFVAIEIASFLFIVAYAWTWKPESDSVDRASAA